MHALLRQYAREKLEDNGQLDEAKKVHIKTLLTYAQEQSDRMYSGHYLESLAGLESEQDNFRGALDWALAGHSVDRGVSLTLALSQFWVIRSQIIEAAGYLERALAYAETAALNYYFGLIQGRLGNQEIANKHFKKAIDLAEITNDYDMMARGYQSLAAHSFFTSEEALEWAEETLALSHIHKSPKVVASCYGVLGLIYSSVSNKRFKALGYHQKALDHYERIGDLQGISTITYNMSIEFSESGDTQNHMSYRVFKDKQIPWLLRGNRWSYMPTTAGIRATLKRACELRPSSSTREKNTTTNFPIIGSSLIRSSTASRPG